jgi:photosystem II stability/assembly factor-like uncharacterized protein
MHAFRTTFFYCLSLIALPLPGIHTAWAEPNVWTSIGPDGGEANALAVDPQSPSTIYAVASGGIFKSTDSGETWKPHGVPNSRGLIALAIDAMNRGTLYVGTISGVFKTTDGGASWTSPQTAFPVNVLAVDPRSAGTIFAGTPLSSGIFKTTDGGATWIAASYTGEAPRVILALALDAQDPSTVYAGALNGLFKSTDSGATFVAAATFAVNALAMEFRDHTTVYANSSTRGVVKSSDGGTTWSAAGSGLPRNFANSLLSDPQHAGTLYAATQNGVFKTTNGGTGWSQANSGLTPTFVRTLAIDPQNPATVFVASGSEGIPGGRPNRGVFKTTNGGAGWTWSSSGLAAVSVSALAIDAEDTATIYGVVSGVLIKRTEVGTGWDNAGVFADDVSSLAIDPQESNTLYATTLTGGGVFKSTDRGTSWNAINSGLPAISSGRLALTEVHTVAIDPQDANTLYVGTFGTAQGVPAGAYKSTAGGELERRSFGTA